MTTLRFDGQAASRLERTYMTPDVVRQREATLALLKLTAGESVIDIGSGPGFLCESMAEQVGPSGKVLGVDISDALLDAARQRNARPQLSYQQGDAIAVPAPDASFDVAVSTQVLEYVAECDRALAEIRRVLKPGGRTLIVATDWDSIVWHSSDRARMQSVLDAWEAHCADPRLPRTLGPLLRAAGFEVTDVTTHTIVNPRLGDDTYSGNLIELIANFVRRRAPDVAADAWREDLHALNAQGRYFFALTRFLFSARGRK
jgi:SAM-dependent methyltransferase